MSEAVHAAFWGLLSGGALVLGAALVYTIPIKPRVVGGVMAFGSGVLISALSFELMDVAFQEAGLLATTIGFLGGAAIYTAANRLLAVWGARHRKRSGNQQPSEGEVGGSGTAIAVGALLDGIPESIALGLTILHGGAVSVATLVAIFLSNLPEGLTSSAGMRKSGRSRTYVFGVWITIALLSGLSSFIGYTVFGGFSPFVIAATTAVAAGAILAMIVDTMIPEAFAETHDFAGLITVLGFLMSFTLSKLT